MAEEITQPTDAQSRNQPTPESPAPTLARSIGKRGKARISVNVEFDLDDADVFNLNGEGIRVVCVVSN